MTNNTEQDKTCPKKILKKKPEKETGKEFEVKSAKFYLAAIATKTNRLFLESISALLTLVIIWLGTLGVLMNRQSVDLTVFKPHYEQWLSEAFSGRKANIESYKAHWIRERQSIELLATNIEFEGKEGTREYISSVSGEFLVGENMLAKPKLIRLSVDGGALTVKRNADGLILVGLGTPKTFQNFGVLWTFGGQKKVQLSQKIEQIQANNAKLYIVDDKDGLKTSFENIKGLLAIKAEGVRLDISGFLLSGEDKGKVDLHVVSSLGGKNVNLHLFASNINPHAIAPLRGKYAQFSALDVPLEVKADIKLMDKSQISDLQLSVKAGEGRVKTGEKFKSFKRANVQANYDPQKQEIVLTAIEIESNTLDITANGLLRTGIKEDYEFDFNITQARIDLGEHFKSPILLKSGKLVGQVKPAKKLIKFENLDLNFGAFDTQMKGAFQKGKDGTLTQLDLDGQVNGNIEVAAVLGLWPDNAAPLTRDWIERSIKKGYVSNLKIFMALDAKDMVSAWPANDHMNISFNVENTDVQYQSQMPILQNATGYGVLQGNQFDMQITEGRIGGLIIDKSSISIPKMALNDGDITVKIDGHGSVADMLRVSNTIPNTFRDNSGLPLDEVQGSGSLNVTFIRPLAGNFDPNKFSYFVEGDFTGVGAPVGYAGYTLNDGVLKFHADRQEMSIGGAVKLGAWPGILTWHKQLGEQKQTANYSFKGKVMHKDLDSFGIGLRSHFGGEIDLTIKGSGSGFSTSEYGVHADFQNADVNFGSIWNKAKGEMGVLDARLVLDKGNGGQLEAISIRSEGLSIEGSLHLAQNFQLKSMNLSTVKIKDFMDLSVKAHPAKEGVLSMYITGAYLNADMWVDKAFKTQSSAVSIPILLTMHLGELSLGDNYVLKDANALFSHNGESVQDARLKGHVSAGSFIAEITYAEDKTRRKIHVVLPDASRAGLALLGLSNTKKGRLEINGFLPPSGKKGGVNGQAIMTDFVLVHAPAFTQLLSLASLQGLVGTLGGKGLAFNELNMQFSLQDGIFKVRKARISGPALGLTGEGNISIANKTLDFNGVLVPSYTVNSILGSVPLLGRILVGKKGEGMFALNYTVKGPFSATQINVNPFSALTPGFLRRIFDKKRDEAINPNVQDLIRQQKIDSESLITRISP
ncbi:MAG: AsmA-like C-terminal domain-containing protein [Robiginitomaculum sp.]